MSLDSTVSKGYAGMPRWKKALIVGGLTIATGLGIIRYHQNFGDRDIAPKREITSVDRAYTIERKIDSEEFYGISENRNLVRVKKEYCNSGSGCLLGEGTYKKFLDAQEIAQKHGYRLIMSSGYRTKERQEELFDERAKRIMDRYNRGVESYNAANKVAIAKKEKKAKVKMAVETARRLARSKVAAPSQMSPHVNGAIDVYFGRTKDGRMLSHPRQMNPYDWQVLEYIMFEAGFESRYKPEEWHFEYGLGRIPGLRNRLHRKDYNPGKDFVDKLYAGAPIPRPKQN